MLLRRIGDLLDPWAPLLEPPRRSGRGGPGGADGAAAGAAVSSVSMAVMEARCATALRRGGLYFEGVGAVVAIEAAIVNTAVGICDRL